MTVITHARRKSRLSKIIDAAGGVSVGAALVQARNHMEKLRPRSLAEVADRISELEQLQATDSPEEAAERLAVAYRAANGVIDSAGPFDLDDVCKAAVGLCDLIDAVSPARPFDWRVLPVFAQSMRLLMALPLEAKEERGRILSSLDRMIDLKLAQP